MSIEFSFMIYDLYAGVVRDMVNSDLDPLANDQKSLCMI